MIFKLLITTNLGTGFSLISVVVKAHSDGCSRQVRYGELEHFLSLQKCNHLPKLHTQNAVRLNEPLKYVKILHRFITIITEVASSHKRLGFEARPSNHHFPLPAEFVPVACLHFRGAESQG